MWDHTDSSSSLSQSVAPRYFLVVSNMRCGSTLLQLMIGTLSDAHTDYEIKWDPAYPPQDVHLVIDRTVSSLKESIDAAIPSNDLVGSKLVFDPVDLSREEYRWIRKIIEADVHVIHIKRPYWEILRSFARGFVHDLAPENEFGQAQGYQILKDRRNLADVLEKSTAIDDRIPRFRDSLHHFAIYLRNDLAALRLRRTHPYYLIAYSAIKSEFPDICRFLQSRETGDRIAQIAADPPLRKLPNIELQRRHIGLRAISKLFDCAFWAISQCLDLVPRATSSAQSEAPVQGSERLAAPGGSADT